MVNGEKEMLEKESWKFDFMEVANVIFRSS